MVRKKKRHELKYHECPPLQDTFWIVREESIGLSNDKYWWVMKSVSSGFNDPLTQCPYPKGIYCCPYCQKPLNEDV